MSPSASVPDEPRLPAALLRSAPRDVRLNATGLAVALLCAASVLGGLWGAAEIHRRAGEPERRAAAAPPAAIAAALVSGTLVAAGVLLAFVRRDRELLAYGRPALAVITRVEKKRSDKGTYWRVEYEWTILSGATRRGHYKHSRRQPPPVGSAIPIVYDRDRPERHRRYPLPLVRLR
jgi:hypothetical protein